MKHLKIAFSLLLLSWVFMLNGCGGGSGGSTGASSPPTPIPPSGAAPVITAFSVNGSTGVITGNRIAITVPYGTDVTALVTTFTASGGVVTANGIPQISGISRNNFSSPVVYTITTLSTSNSTTASAKATSPSNTTYTVTVTVASISDKSITAFALNTSSTTAVTSGIISILNISVVMPSGTDLTSLTTTFSTSGINVTVNGVTQISGVTRNNFTSPVTFTVTAANGTMQNYRVTVTVASTSANDIIEFSLNGSPGVISQGGLAQTIVVNVPFGTNLNGLVATFITTGTSVVINGVAQTSGTTQNDFTNSVNYIVTAANGTIQTYTVTVTVSSSSSNFIDSFSFGNISGVIVGQNIGITLPVGTNVAALVATFTTTGTNVTVGGITQTSTQTANDFTNPVTYTVVAADGSTANYTVIVTIAAAASSTITAFSFGTTEGVIVGTNIAVNMPFGTNVTNLIATFTTTGTSVSVLGVPQVSGTTTNNFTTPVAYVVRAADGSTTTYTVTVTVASSSAKAITAYALAGVSGNITNFNIAVTVPFGTDVTNLTATFTTTGVGVSIGGVTQNSGGTPTNNFTNPVVYTVTAADGTTQNYTVTVTVAGNPAKAITAFSINGYSGTINGLTILVRIQFGTPLTALTSVFTATGVNVSVNGATQVSGSGTNNFTSPVPYLVTAADGSTNIYTVTVDNTGNVWTWMGGTSDVNQNSVYGTRGTAAPGNMPGNRDSGRSWADSSGNLWFFGGQGYEASSTFGSWNDLWKYNISSGYWTWMGGNTTTISQNGVYGVQSIPDPNNLPGSRYLSISWIDSSGNLWLFGGDGFDAASLHGNLNDLWKFNPTTGTYGEWAWMSGASTLNASGVYNTQGVANPSSVPGARQGSISWIDASGNLWLFGGNGVDSVGTTGNLNDLWNYNPITGYWTWMGGSMLANQNGTYGTQGTPSTSNIPGARQRAISWIDASGNLWLFGGNGRAATLGNGFLNDLWKYKPSDGTWTWVNGPNTRNGVATYGTQGISSASNIPGSRQGSCSWIDSSGNLWLFAGFGKGTSIVNTSLNDVWKFNPSSGEWTWVNGTNITGGTYGVYGTLGIPDANNAPGVRDSSACWTDSSGNFWVLGGVGYPASGINGELNDLWKYKP